MSLKLNLIGPPPWGFRLSGGRDFKKAITVSKVAAGSKADLANLQVGDIIVEINGESAASMLNMEAQRKITNSRAQLLLLVERSTGLTSGLHTPEQLAEHFQALQAGRDENQNYREAPFCSPVCLSPRPISPDLPVSLKKKSAASTPTSSSSIQLRAWSPGETSPSHRIPRTSSEESSFIDHKSHPMSGRTPSPHSLIGRQRPPSPRLSLEQAAQKNPRNSEVYKMIRGRMEFRAAPRQSNTFHALQEALEAEEKAVVPETAARFRYRPLSSSFQSSSSKARDQVFPTCERCGTRILRYRHAECFVCTHCGLSLRTCSHTWVGEDLLCERHARERRQGRAGAPYC
ncbi:PDZ and LIM domain protein 2-like [Megalops cyprinoides]|uniref:PDZ and LIM domain protein 2-like n=1 Tax=Megalops cyprinoides TaxID=118141 RepID=UPI00186560DE|nr:PDZ and LIM domain protein 2-like [Megalops cyprinoides]